MTDAALPDFDGIVVLPDGGQPVEQVFWLMHGYNGDAKSFAAGLVPALKAAFPRAAFYIPEGKLPARGGGRQHFDLEKHFNRHAFQRPPETWTAAEWGKMHLLAENAEDCAREVNETLDVILRHHNLTDSAVVMIGYSHGSQAVLRAAMQRDRPVAAAVGIFGNLWIPDPKAEPEIRSRPPVILSAGKDDAIVPFHAVTLTAEFMRRAQAPVTLLAIEHVNHYKDWNGAALREVLPLLKKLLPSSPLI